MADTEPLTFEKFANIMNDLGLERPKRIAVGVSGGPDSMALCRLLSLWADEAACDIHALIVDHGLRAESAKEAVQAQEAVSVMPHVTPHILKWEGEKPDTALQEEARKARYGLMAEYCQAHDIGHLLLAHHRDDQAETFLFRLAKGSGLDGLSGMRRLQVFDEKLTLVRPLLDISKDELVAFCQQHDVSYIRDPSNENTDFARVRLRKAREVLEEEGLSAKRLSVTARRLERARRALDEMTEKALNESAEEKNTNRFVFDFEILKNWSDEIILRVIGLAMADLGLERDYAPRMEKLEALFTDLMREENFRKRTLGGVVFERNDKAGLLVLSKE